jgi:hypothetical protein
MSDELVKQLRAEATALSSSFSDDVYGTLFAAADLLEQQAARIAELEARAGEANVGEVKATSWLIIQPNGRSYVVNDIKKVNIARNCGYSVQAIVDTTPPTGDAAGKDSVDAALGPEFRKAVELYDTLMATVQGCTDGGCMIRAPGGMHTNGGCRCHRDSMKTQRVLYAAKQLRAAIASLTKTADGEKDA